VSDTVVIEIGNVVSTLRASEEIVAVVRHFVAYQKAVLPPIPVQLAIRALFADKRRTGGRQDVYACLG
jgi:hypothetical protein